MSNIIGTSKADPIDIFSSMVQDHENGDYSKFANSFNNFLHSVSADLPPFIPKPDTFPSIANIEDEYLISVDQVERQLMRVKNGKAAGPDGIQAWMLRDLAPLLAPPLTAIYNSSLQEGYVPDK